VKKLTFQDLDNIPTEFRTVPSAVYDQISAVPDANPHPGCLIAKIGRDNRRAYLLTMVVWNTLLAFVRQLCLLPALLSFRHCDSTVNQRCTDSRKDSARINSS
jgi:hypothetical protein